MPANNGSSGRVRNPKVLKPAAGRCPRTGQFGHRGKHRSNAYAQKKTMRSATKYTVLRCYWYDERISDIGCMCIYSEYVRPGISVAKSSGPGTIGASPWQAKGSGNLRSMARCNAHFELERHGHNTTHGDWAETSQFWALVIVVGLWCWRLVGARGIEREVR